MHLIFLFLSFLFLLPYQQAGEPSLSLFFYESEVVIVSLLQEYPPGSKVTKLVSEFSFEKIISNTFETVSGIVYERDQFSSKGKTWKHRRKEDSWVFAFWPNNGIPYLKL